MARPRSAQRGEPAATAEYVVVALGGATGAVLRAAIEATWPPPPEGVIGLLLEPIFGINLLGAWLLGMLLALLERGQRHPLLRPFLAIGVLGSFTTFSTLALQVAELAPEGGLAIAAAKLFGSVTLGLAAFQGGERLIARSG